MMDFHGKSIEDLKDEPGKYKCPEKLSIEAFYYRGREAWLSPTEEEATEWKRGDTTLNICRWCKHFGREESSNFYTPEECRLTGEKHYFFER